ncbi:unnamed protein product, partial [marine sediment metagenome]
DTVSVTVTQEPGFGISSAISLAIPLAVLGLVCATVGGIARSMGGSSSSPKQLGATEFSPEVQAVIDKWRSQIAKGEPLVESEARKEIIRAQGYKGGVGETDRAIRAIKEPPTVKCPICGKVIEVPEYDKVTRSEALRKHIEDKHHSSPGQSEHHSVGERVYSMDELAEIAKIMYECTARKTATIYTPTGPVYTKWENFSQPERERAIHGLKERIEREGLRGYLERKRPMAGDVLTNEIISELEVKGFLSEHHSPWLTPEQRKLLESKWGGAATRFAEE